ncbi:MAG: c(7)-type cytochrome triheme domain-containing protein [Thermodesulfobacteriota bacterium]
MSASLFVAACFTLLVFTIASEAANPNLGDMLLDSKIESMKKAGVNPVIFPHTFHEKILKCKSCHNSIFKDERGANDISMKKNMTGQACGSANCHNSTKAFPLYECAKCHRK